MITILSKSVSLGTSEGDWRKHSFNVVELRRKYSLRNQLLGVLCQRKLTITFFNTSFIHFYFNNLSFRPRRKTTNDKLMELMELLPSPSFDSFLSFLFPMSLFFLIFKFFWFSRSTQHTKIIANECFASIQIEHRWLSASCQLKLNLASHRSI